MVALFVEDFISTDVDIVDKLMRDYHAPELASRQVILRVLKTLYPFGKIEYFDKQPGFIVA
jgi:hypothetical protein